MDGCRFRWPGVTVLLCSRTTWQHQRSQRRRDMEWSRRARLAAAYQARQAAPYLRWGCLQIRREHQGGARRLSYAPCGRLQEFAVPKPGRGKPWYLDYQKCPMKIIHSLPWIGRVYRQRDVAGQERDAARQSLESAQREHDLLVNTLLPHMLAG